MNANLCTLETCFKDEPHAHFLGSTAQGAEPFDYVGHQRYHAKEGVVLTVNVAGPGVTNAWGSINHMVKKRDDVTETPGGTLIIKTMPWKSPRQGQIPAREVVYAKGMWSRFTVTEIPEPPQ